MSGGSKFGRGMGGLIVLLLGLAGGGLIALSPDIALPLAVLLLPGLLALIVDRTPGCAVARAILLCCALPARTTIEELVISPTLQRDQGPDTEISRWLGAPEGVAPGTTEGNKS